LKTNWSLWARHADIRNLGLVWHVCKCIEDDVCRGVCVCPEFLNTCQVTLLGVFSFKLSERQKRKNL